MELETNRTRAHNSSVLSQPHHHRRLRLRPCMSVCFCYATHIKGLQVKVLIRYVCTRDIHKHGLGAENQSRCPFKYSVSPKFSENCARTRLILSYSSYVFLSLNRILHFHRFLSSHGHTSILAFSKPSWRELWIFSSFHRFEFEYWAKLIVLLYHLTCSKSWRKNYMIHWHRHECDVLCYIKI